jgi:hypothetical protein
LHQLASVATAHRPGPSLTQQSVLGRLFHAVNIKSALQIIVGTGESVASKQIHNLSRYI